MEKGSDGASLRFQLEEGCHQSPKVPLKERHNGSGERLEGGLPRRVAERGCRWGVSCSQARLVYSEIRKRVGGRWLATGRADHGRQHDS